MSYIRPSILRLTDRLTLADISDCVRRNAALSRRRREDIVSALNTAATVLQRDLADIPADPLLIGRRLAEAPPAAHHVSERRWANVRSLVNAALALVMPVLPGRQIDPLHPAWQALADKLMERYGRVRLSCLMHFCSARGILPEAVGQSTFGALEKALAESLRKDPAENYRETVRAWNKASQTIQGWPAFRAERPSRRRIWTLTWSAFPLLAPNKDAWLSRLSGEDPASDRILRPRTLTAMDYMLREAASALALQGWDQTRFSEVGHFGTLDAFKAVLRFMVRRRDGNPGRHIPVVAWMLRGIAKHEARAPASDLGEMSKIIRRLQGKQTLGMTETNARRLKPFDDPAIVEIFRNLPSTMEKEARKCKSPCKAARLMQMALAIELLLVTLMRVKNLADLDPERHFVRGSQGLWIWIPKEQAKGKLSLEFPLPQRTLRLLEIYLREYRQFLVTTPTTALFPGRKGGGKQSCGFGTQIRRAIERFTGLIVNPHLVRHIGAKLYLDAHPGAYETVRRMLGHRQLSVTIGFYTGFETGAAFRQYHTDVLGVGDPS